jgi:[ribosomal protein S5]-alanine N-acetyltransferase
VPRTVPPVVPAGRMRERRQPTLAASPDIQLRPWIEPDAGALLSAFEDPEIRHWHMRRVDTEAEARHWIGTWGSRWIAETDAGWAIVDRGSGELSGQVALRTISLEFGVAQITYWVVPAARGRGVATAAAREVARWALDDLGLHRVSIHHSTRNERSCRVAERAGFALEATMRRALLHVDGWHDMHAHVRIRDQG